MAAIATSSSSPPAASAAIAATSTAAATASTAPPKPPMTTKELADFLRISTSTLAQPDFIRRLGSIVLGAPSSERGALVEQLLAREYELVWRGATGRDLSGNACDDGDNAADTSALSKTTYDRPYMTTEEWAAFSKEVCGPDEEDPRGDRTLMLVLEALDYHVNVHPGPHSKVLTQCWAQVQLMEERAVTRAHLEDTDFEKMVALDELCETKVTQYARELWEEIPLAEPQARVQIIQKIRSAGQEALTKKAANFNEMGPSERQAVIESMSAEERDPILRMNALREVMNEMQRMQMIGQQLLQQYMKIIPQMDIEQQKAQHDRLQAKAVEVLPAGFLEMSVQEKQRAVQQVRKEDKMPVMKWNAMCMALQILANGGHGGHGHGHGHGHRHGHGHGHSHGQHGHSHGQHVHGHSHGGKPCDGNH